MSENAKTTPGPWRVEVWEYPTATPPRKDLVIQTDEHRIAVLDWDTSGRNPYTIEEPEARANAALMAAAPTMRDALRDIASGRVTGENAAALARCVLGGAS